MPPSRPSAFDTVIDQRLTVTQGGDTRELGVEEALQLKTYQDALSGNRPARREILKMIAKREIWLAAKRPPPAALPHRYEIDPENANEALVILGIASRDAKVTPTDPYERFLLEPWAVEAALRRSSRRTWSDKELLDIRRCSRDHQSLPRPVGQGK